MGHKNAEESETPPERNQSVINYINGDNAQHT